MKILIKFLSIYMLILTLFSCDEFKKYINFDQPKIEKVYPAANAENVDIQDSVIINFSKEMDINSSNNAISLTGNTTPISGKYSWNRNKTKVTFTPNKPLTDYNVYTITIDSTAEDTEGNDLSDNFSSNFYTVSDISGPEIIDYSPSDNATGIDPSSEIKIQFNEEIDTDSVYSSISFSPPIEGTFLFDNDNKEVTYRPYSDLSYGNTYILTISTSLKDINKNNMNEEFSFNFTVGDEYTPLTLNSIKQQPQTDGWKTFETNHNIDTYNSIIITFSNELQWSSVIDQISFNPEAFFYFIVNDAQVEINFINSLEPETNYNITISKNVSDIQNNSLEESIVYTFVTDSVNSIRPIISQISDPNGNWTAIHTGSEQILTLTTAPLYEDVTIRFSKQMNPHTIQFDVEQNSGLTIGTPYIYNPSWNSNYDELTINLGGISAPSLYKLTIKGEIDGAQDSDGFTMKEDFIQYFRF